MPMREMKQSGIEWIRDVPCTWQIQKISSLYALRSQKVSDRDYPPLSVTKKGIVLQLENVAKTTHGNDRKLVRKGDFVINSRSDRRGSCGISPYDGSVSNINIVLCPFDANDPRYFNWLFHTEGFADEFYKWGSGIVDDLWSTRWQEMKKISLPIPAFSEQKAISDFLDTKCNEIDALTSDIEKQIETLQEYKKSIITEAVTKGLDPKVETKLSEATWFKIAPLKWKIIPLKYCVSICSRKSLNNQNYIGLENVKSWDGIVDRSTNPITSEGDALNFEKGDVLFGKLRPYLAKCFIAEEDGCCSTEFLVMKPISIDGSYLKYLLLSNIFIDTVNMSTYGVKMPRASWDFVGNIKIPNPPIEEQSKIATYLDDRCESLNSLITQKNTQINMLTKYKQSLIYEYVTGKKTVPNA